MADVAISGLPAASSISGSDTIAIVQGGVTKKAAKSLEPISTLQQAALDLKAPLASPALTGTPTAPTAAPGTDSTQIATTGFIKAAIDVVKGGVSAAFDTLSEIATQLGLLAPLASPTFTGNVNLPATTTTATDLTAVPPATGGWKEYFVTGSNATTTGQALVDITGLVTDPLSNSTKYEIEVVLDVLQSADVNGCKFGIHVAGTGTAGTCRVAGVGTSTTGNAAASYSLTAVDTATNGTFVSFSAGTGSFVMKGWVETTSTGTTTISIQHLKVTSGTSSIKPGSILRIRKAHT